jgi:hypothetical protein
VHDSRQGYLTPTVTVEEDASAGGAVVITVEPFVTNEPYDLVLMRQEMR